MNHGRWPVSLIMLAQWLGTSLWFSPNSAADVIGGLAYRAAALGYFGHMWESYVFGLHRPGWW